MIGWLIALAVIVGLAIMPLGVAARYDEDGPLLRLIVEADTREKMEAKRDGLLAIIKRAR